ncbi:MAG: ThaI family type II restriction endonuclease [Candidatus Zixiibacteriota bacterium]
MANRTKEIFGDPALIKKVVSKLPFLFQIAELESSRAGKIGMEVGSLREKILISLLIYKFGESNIETGSITDPEVDVTVDGSSLSIKTITGKELSGVKIIWTVDPDKAREFLNSYVPICDILLVQIYWGDRGGLYFIPLDVQKDVFNSLGRERYIKLPKKGTNPRGVELSKEALTKMRLDRRTNVIEIEWKKTHIEFDAYKRWVDYWKE